MKKLSSLILLIFTIILLASCVTQNNITSEAPSKTYSEPEGANDTSPETSTPTESENIIEIYYFYDTICASCPNPGEFNNIVSDKIYSLKDEHPYSTTLADIYDDEGKYIYESVIEEYGLNKSEISIPAMVIGGKVYSGNENIEKNIEEALLSTSEYVEEFGKVYKPKDKKLKDKLFEDYKLNPDNSTIVYFYRTTCEDCIKFEPVMNLLKSEVNAPDSTINLDIVSINTRAADNSDRISVFFENYSVPDTDKVVPIIFFTDSYFIITDEIDQLLDLGDYESVKNILIEKLKNGDGVDFQFPSS